MNRFQEQGQLAQEVPRPDDRKSRKKRWTRAGLTGVEVEQTAIKSFKEAGGEIVS